MSSSLVLPLNLEIIADSIKIDGKSTIIPYAIEDVDENREEICELIVGKQCKVIDSYIIDDEDEDEDYQSSSKTMIVCRDLEQGHYLVVFVQPSTNEDECLASYLYLFSQTKEAGELENIWSKLTCKASDDDWVVLDEIFEDIIFLNDDSSKHILFIYKNYDRNVDKQIPNSVSILLEQVYGFLNHLCEDEQLPAFAVVDCEMQRSLCAILNHPDGFAKKVMVWDEFEEVYLDSRHLDDLHDAYTALCIDMRLRHAYVPFEETLESIFINVEYGELYTSILDQLTECDREKVERIILEREDIILREEFIEELTTLTATEREIIAKRSKQKKD